MAVRALLLRGYPEKLKYTEQDVNLVCQTFMRLNISTEILMDCSGSDALNKVIKVCSEAYRNDTLIIYYTGHGELNKGALNLIFPGDENMSYYPLQASWICDLLVQSKYRKTLLILDCCHAQKVAENVKHNKQDRVHIFCSSEEAESSWELDEYGRSAFTHFMCEAVNELSGEKKDLTLADVEQRTREKIKEYNRQHNRNIPCCAAHGIRTDELVLVTTTNPQVSDHFGYKSSGIMPASKLNMRPFLDKLLQPLSPHCFGCAKLLDSLERWIDEPVSVVCFHGPVGIGKSTLIYHYLHKLVNRHPAQKDIFYWSFDCYDSNGSPVSDLSDFFEAALTYYGCDGDVQGLDDLSKADILCEKIKARRSILVLDDFQVFQSYTSIDNNIVDRAMRTLITNLAWDGLHNGGLVILLSTLRVSELDKYTIATNFELLPLSKEDCLELFRKEDISGEEAQFERISDYFNRNPLLLTLLTRLLRTKFNRRLSDIDNVSILSALHGKKTPEGQSLDRVIAYYASLWPLQSEENMLLMLFSLLRRPIRASVLANLVKQEGMASEMGFLLEASHSIAILEVLEKLGLLICVDDTADGIPANKKRYTLLPTVRDYYLDCFRNQKHELFLISNRCLAKYMLEIFNDRAVESVKDMEPLYDAVYYLTNAQQYTEALDIVWYRICRERKFFSQKIIGAYSNDLHAASHFFVDKNSWVPVSDLADVDAAWICSYASYLLNTMGNLKASEMTRRSAMGINERIGNKLMLASDQQHLGRILFLQAKISEAEEQFRNVLSIVNDEFAIKERSIKSRYASEMVPDAIRTNTLVRYAFLHYLQGENHYQKAAELIGDIAENYNFTGTSASYYYLVLHGICKDQKTLSGLGSRVQHYLDRAIASGKPHEIAYAYMMRAFNKSAKLKATFKPLFGVNMESVIEDIEQALKHSKSVERMDQYPFILLIIARIYLDMYQKSYFRNLKEKLSDRIKRNFELLENTLNNRDIPLYEIELGFLNLEWANVLGKREKAKEIYRQMCEKPETLKYFGDRFNSVFSLWIRYSRKS